MPSRPPTASRSSAQRAACTSLAAPSASAERSAPPSTGHHQSPSESPLRASRKQLFTRLRPCYSGRVTTSRVRDISWKGEGLLPPPLLRGAALRYTALRPSAVDAISVHHTTGAGLSGSATVAREIAYLRTTDT